MPDQFPEKLITSSHPGVGLASHVLKCNLLRWSWVQIAILAFIGFSSRGMWSALNALGGAGTQEIEMATLINSVSSAGYCALGWLAGCVVNLVGPRLSILAGCVTIATLTTLFYLYAFHRLVSPAFLVPAAFADGIGATFLWSAVSYVLLFYPHPSERGRAMTIFNFIYNSGAVTGALIAFFLNSQSIVVSEVAESTMTSSSYIIILCIIYGGCALCSLLKDPSQILPARSKAEPPRSSPKSSPLQELQGLWQAATHRYTAHLFFLFLVGTWHLVFLFNWMNAGYFNVRSRAANSSIYWMARILATVPVQLSLDSTRSSFRRRAFRGYLLLATTWLAAFTVAGAVCLLSAYHAPSAKLDIRDTLAVLPILAFALFGALDTIGQSFTIWVIGALPIDPATAARLCGVYRSFQGFGQMVAFVLDIQNVTPYRLQFLVCFLLWLSALIPLLFLISRHLDNRTELPCVIADLEPPTARPVTERTMC